MDKLPSASIDWAPTVCQMTPKLPLFRLWELLWHLRISKEELWLETLLFMMALLLWIPLYTEGKLKISGVS